MKLKAVFLDKDGTLLPRLRMNGRNKKVQLKESFVEGLQLLQSHGYLLVIVSNKNDGSAEEKPEEFSENIVSSCSRLGIYLDGIYFNQQQNQSTAGIADGAAQPLIKAANDMDIDLSMSWMVGDIPDDVEAGKKAGCNTVFVTHRKNDAPKANARYKARNLAEAAKKIVRRS